MPPRPLSKAKPPPRHAVEFPPLPTREADGHEFGFAAKLASGHAFCSVVSREGSWSGRLVATAAMFACPSLG